MNNPIGSTSTGSNEQSPRRSVWDTIIPWRTADPADASLRYAALTAVYGIIVYLCLVPYLLLVVALSLPALLIYLDSNAEDLDFATLPLLVMIIVLYALGPLGSLAGITLGIRGLFKKAKGKAVIAVVLNGILLACIVLLFLFAYALSG